MRKAVRRAVAGSGSILQRGARRMAVASPTGGASGLVEKVDAGISQWIFVRAFAAA